MNRSFAVPRAAMFGLTLALASTSGCAEEPRTVAAKDYSNALALGYCKAVYSCPCDGYPYANANACFSSLADAYNKVVSEAAFAGLSYDGTCPGQELNQIEALGCSSTTADSGDFCRPPCNAWHGSTATGGPCQVFATSAERGLAFSNCAQGLTCVAQVCVNPCQVGGALPQLGQPCPDLVCAAGAMCDATMTCVAQTPLPGPGAPCSNGLCDPKRAVCVIEAGACAALPSVGQACVAGQCDPTAYCGPDNLCLARPALACSLLGASIPGDGDGDPTTGDGDGDGDPTTGDGDGDPTTGDGDGDGDPTTGDGDGDGAACGWDGGGYYCGGQGADPDGQHPYACPPDLFVEGPCGSVTDIGCCDANGDNWWCSGGLVYVEPC